MFDGDEEEEAQDVIPTKTKPGPKPKPTTTVEIACPDCGCDYVLGAMKIMMTKTFAGNRLQVEWPSREGVHNTALLACPACGIMYKVNTDGTIAKTGNKWAKRKGKK